MSSISVNIVRKTISVTMNRVPVSSSGGDSWQAVTGITITGGQNNIIDTEQSAIRPVAVIFEDASGKEINKNIGSRTVGLSGTYLVTVYSSTTYSNITMHYR